MVPRSAAFVNGGGKVPASQPSPGETTFSLRRRPGKAGQSPCFPSFFLAAAHKVKGKVVGLWSHLPVRSAQGVSHRQTAPHTPQLLKKLAKLLRSLRSAPAAHVRWWFDEHER